MNRNTLKGMALGLALVGSGLLLGVSWNAGYEGVPDGATALAADIDLFIQSVKTEVRQHLEVEHLFGGNTDDNGLHQMGSARCFLQNGAPTDISGGVGLLGQYNSAASADGGTALTTDEIGPTVRDLGAGRCWIDLDGPDGVAGTPDDGSLATWNETANIWVYADLANSSAVTVAAQRFFFDPGKYNLVANGSFEITDGTGLLASILVPLGWLFVAVNPGITYTSPPSATIEGVGVQVNLARGAGDGGIEQTLGSLKSDTTYYAVARTRAVGGATCELSTAGAGGTNLAPQTTASATYTTLSGIFTTTAGVVDTLTVRLRVLTAGSCNFRGVAVYELSQDRRGLSQPGIQVCRDTDSSATDDAYTTAGIWVDGLVLCEVTVPGPGYIIEVNGTLVADNDEGSQANVLAVRLREEGVTVDLKIGIAFQNSDAANRFEDIVSVPVHFVNLNPTPGTTLTYTLEASPGVTAGNPTWDRNLGDDGVDDLNDGANLATVLEVMLIPTR